MNRQELLQHLVAWLENEQIKHETDTDDTTVAFHLSGSSGTWHCHLICEEQPALLQIICRLPARVPPAKLATTAQLLHAMNSTLRLGTFTLNSEDRAIYFRLAMPVRGEAPVHEQIGPAFATTMATFDRAFGLLCLFLFDDTERRKRLTKLRPKTGAEAGFTARLRCRGLELN